MSDYKTQALQYHRRQPSGKLMVVPSKPCTTTDDLSLAYSPGVAHPCLEIQKHPADSYLYTMRGNTVGVVTNGTAVLGLGDVGPLASLPVMEGKCMLLKRFADINGIPLALESPNTESFIDSVSALEPSFGAINLEDIKAPECFIIEDRLRERMKIPVFHDDQHGTAIIVGAALLGSLQVVGKTVREIKVVINGSGAAGIAIAQLLVAAGMRREQLFLLDRHGIITQNRDEDMNPYKAAFAQAGTDRTLREALADADVFVGVSTGNLLSEEMIRCMKKQAIIFALANPSPEVNPEDAKQWGAAVIATGRSDYPNQVNNALGFPGIFRAVLDVRASRITTKMKLAAMHALHQLTLKPVPDHIQEQYSVLYPEEYKRGIFRGPCPLSSDYIIPKLFDPRLVPAIARSVAEAAISEQVAQYIFPDLSAYERQVQEHLNAYETDKD